MNDTGTSGSISAETDPRSFTYFVRDGDVIKIGSSVQPKKRIGGLQSGIARPLEVLAVVPMAIADEFATHQQFAHLRVRGEWFRAEVDLLQFVERIKAHHAVKALAAKPEPTAMAKRLTALRRERGAHTQIGYRCTNLLEALPIYEKSTDESQRAILARSIGRWTTELAGMLKAA